MKNEQLIDFEATLTISHSYRFMGTVQGILKELGLENTEENRKAIEKANENSKVSADLEEALDTFLENRDCPNRNVTIE